MIPEYLKGKSAAQIVGEMGDRFRNSVGAVGVEQRYIQYLEGLLLLAVKDALMNADYEDSLSALEAEQRAIAFLNMVLPYENKT